MKKLLSAVLLALILISSVFLCGCQLFEQATPTPIPTPFYPTLPPITSPPATPTPTPTQFVPTATPEPTPTPTRPPVFYTTAAPPLNTPVPILYRIEVSIAAQIVTVYSLVDDSIVKQFICTTGAKSTPTPLGSFTIQRQERWLNFPEFGGSWGQYTSNIVDQIWFHSLTYKSKDSSTLNSSAYGNLGNRASHGCIRLLCGDAYWIFTNCRVGTQVDIIEGKPNPTLNAALRPSPSTLKSIYDPALKKYVYWDPTDPNPANPWNKQ